MDQLSNPLLRYRVTRHQIPTHLNVPDKILSLWGVGVTVRQLLILLLGWSGMANAWARLGWLNAGGGSGVALHIVVTVIPAIIAIFVAFKQIAGRPLEVWFMVLLRYWGQPNVCLWRSVCKERSELLNQEAECDLSGEARSAPSQWPRKRVNQTYVS